jgi:iron complex outermembrane receptor protein
MNKLFLKGILGATTALGLVQLTPTFAQAAAAASDVTSLTDIVVQARRKGELQQDVPLVVNALPAAELEKLNIRDMHDITAVVPGLTLTTNPNGIATTATLRGIDDNVNASGNNGTVEFYLNDATITPSVLLQAMYDVSQVEVLRGPQGTLRGRASPSGSITVTTTRPNLYTYGGYAEGTANNIGGVNVNGGINVPLIQGMLAVRVAGLVNDDEGNRVHSINDPNQDPYSHTHAERVTVRFDPIESLDIVASYEDFANKYQHFDQVESANFADPTRAASPVFITPKQRLAVETAAARTSQEYKVYNLQAEWKIAGQKVNYVGAFSNQLTIAGAPNDQGGIFSTFPGNAASPNDPFKTGFATAFTLQNAAQTTQTLNREMSHEIRLSSDERVFGMFDYVLGAFYRQQSAPFDLWSQTPLFFDPSGAAPTKATPIAESLSPLVPYVNTNIIQSGAKDFERSIFADATVHLTDADEISVGGRYIDFTTRSLITISGVGAFNNPKDHFTHMIYSASIKHRFNDSLMVYFNTGTSWRDPVRTNQIIDATGRDNAPYGALLKLYTNPPETSVSYEAGIKTDWLEKRLQVDVTYYHQDFTNFIYTPPSTQIAARFAVVNGTATTPGSNDVFILNNSNPGLAVGVPAKVDGVEADIAFRATPHWNMSADLSYSMSQIENGKVPCNIGATTPQQILAASGGQQIVTCSTNTRASFSPPFAADFQSEYSRPIMENYDGFIRGLLQVYGANQNDPSNPLSAVPAYALANLYVGVRDPHSKWTITGYVKNIFNTQEVLQRNAQPATAAYAFTNLAPPPFSSGGAGALTSTYRSIPIMTAPQEIGVSFKYQFGSH